MRAILLLLLAMVISGCGSAANTPDAHLAAAGCIPGCNRPPSPPEEVGMPVSPRVYFDFNSAILTAAGREILGQQAVWLSKNTRKLLIEGHADERGTREYNLALGERRAKATRDYLVNQGLAPERISTVSYGKERPLALGSDDHAWSRNRRTVTVLITE